MAAPDWHEDPPTEVGNYIQVLSDGEWALTRIDKSMIDGTYSSWKTRWIAGFGPTPPRPMKDGWSIGR